MLAPSPFSSYVTADTARRLTSPLILRHASLQHRGQWDNFLFGAEYALLFFLERLGYGVSYASCAGTGRVCICLYQCHLALTIGVASLLFLVCCADVENLWRAGQLTRGRHRALLSIGHDEYYTQVRALGSRRGHPST